MNASENHLSAFVDYVTLTYHEARNVRHLVGAGPAGLERYRRLINLPRNREDAWRELQALRTAAKSTNSANAVEAVFQKKFGPGLEDLEDLFENSHWRHSAFGGNRWAGITRALSDLS